MLKEDVYRLEHDFFSANNIPIVPEVLVSTDDSVINEKYLKGEVRIVTEQARYPLSSIETMFSGESYILNPEFQRRHRWDVVKQSKLIESFIMNVPVPPIFLYEKEFSVYEVMDGLQRITAIKDFYADKYELCGLEQWQELNGRKYSTLPEQIKKGIDRRYISSIILLKETAKSEDEAQRLKQMVFARINSGGAKLEDQESRNAQYQGEFNSMLITLARDKYFCEIFGIPLPDENENLQGDIISDELKGNPVFKTMKDVENVLRFFALRHLELWEDMSLSKFLDHFSSIATKFPLDLRTKYEELFHRTIKLAYDIYGDYTFSIWRRNSLTNEFRWIKRASMVIYDPMMIVLSDFVDKSEMLVSNREVIVAATKQLFQEHEDMFNGRNTSKSNVSERVEAIRSIICEIIA